MNTTYKKSSLRPRDIASLVVSERVKTARRRVFKFTQESLADDEEWYLLNREKKSALAYAAARDEVGLDEAETQKIVDKAYEATAVVAFGDGTDVCVGAFTNANTLNITTHCLSEEALSGDIFRLTLDGLATHGTLKYVNSADFARIFVDSGVPCALSIKPLLEAPPLPPNSLCYTMTGPVDIEQYGPHRLRAEDIGARGGTSGFPLLSSSGALAGLLSARADGIETIFAGIPRELRGGATRAAAYQVFDSMRVLPCARMSRAEYERIKAELERRYGKLDPEQLRDACELFKKGMDIFLAVDYERQSVVSAVVSGDEIEIREFWVDSEGEIHSHGQASSVYGDSDEESWNGGKLGNDAALEAVWGKGVTIGQLIFNQPTGDGRKQNTRDKKKKDAPAPPPAPDPPAVEDTSSDEDPSTGFAPFSEDPELFDVLDPEQRLLSAIAQCARNASDEKLLVSLGEKAWPTLIKRASSKPAPTVIATPLPAAPKAVPTIKDISARLETGALPTAKELATIRQKAELDKLKEERDALEKEIRLTEVVTLTAVERETYPAVTHAAMLERKIIKRLRDKIKHRDAYLAQKKKADEQMARAQKAMTDLQAEYSEIAQQLEFLSTKEPADFSGSQE